MLHQLAPGEDTTDSHELKPTNTHKQVIGRTDRAHVARRLTIRLAVTTTTTRQSNATLTVPSGLTQLLALSCRWIVSVVVRCAVVPDRD